MKNIEKAIKGYHSDQVSINDLQTFLSFKEWDTLNKQNHYNSKLINRIITKESIAKGYTSPTAPNPEDILINQESTDGFNELLDVFQKFCSKRDFEIYKGFFVYGEKQAKLAEEYSLSRSAISMIILRVNTKIRKYFSRHPEQAQLFKDFLLQEVNK